MEQGEQRLIERVVDFTDRIVREVMTPRKDIVWIRQDAASEELITLCTREGVSRVLVCGTDLDDVRGIILAKDLLRLVNQPTDVLPWKSLIRPPYVVPDTKPIDDLLAELRSNGTHLAVVLDEHGGVGGIVTLEDLVEQIVGDIFDETDGASDREPEIRHVDGVWHIDGGASIEQLPEVLHIPESEGHYDTIAGYLLFKVGRLPSQGDVFEFDGLECRVLEVHGHRIARLALSVRPAVVDGAANSPELPLVVNGSTEAPVKS
jgi:CBS domain containing-hemolysin-like protein